MLENILFEKKLLEIEYQKLIVEIADVKIKYDYYPRELMSLACDIKNSILLLDITSTMEKIRINGQNDYIETQPDIVEYYRTITELALEKLHFEETNKELLKKAFDLNKNMLLFDINREIILSNIIDKNSEKTCTFK